MNPIQLEQLEDMFADMRTRTDWNVDGPLLWGYFFFDSSRENLMFAAAELARDGYRVVGVEPAPQGTQYRLHVEKVEVHTPATLHELNTRFYELVARRHLASYDGMDAGPVPQMH